MVLAEKLQSQVAKAESLASDQETIQLLGFTVTQIGYLKDES